MRASPKWVFLGIVAFGLPVSLTIGWLLGTPPPARSTAGAPGGASGMGAAPRSDLETTEPVSGVGYGSHPARPASPEPNGAPASAPPVAAAPAVSAAPPAPGTLPSSPSGTTGRSGALTPPSPPPTVMLPPVPTPTEVLIPPASPSATPSDGMSPAPSTGDPAELARTQ